MIFTGRSGTLRIYDGAEEIARGAQSNMSVYVYDDSGSSFTDKTSEAFSDDTSYTGTFWVDSPDKIYIGAQYKFGRIRFLSGGGALAVGAGALTLKYYDGSSWVAITDKNDGTSSGGNTFAQDGYIDFAIPHNWAKQGDASLDSDMYYVELSPGSYPGTEPSADILAPVDGQFYDVVFENMDFSGPLGRPLSEEILVLDRDRMNSDAHYIEGSDEIKYEAVPISFSCNLADDNNAEYIKKALECGNPGSTYWDAAGTTTKGDTKNDGTNYNPTFVDSDKKTVDIQTLWSNTSGTYDQGVAYYEVYFPKEEVSIQESDDSVSLSASGGAYGVIELINGLGDRY